MSLKQILQRHLIENMIQSVRSKSDEYVVLVVDAHTTRILSSCCRMYDIMETGVLVLENLMLSREKLDLSAIYFISNTSESIRQVINDFSHAKPQYASAHLFFTGHVSPEHMKLIAAEQKLVKRIKTFQELNVDFIATESRVFTFGGETNAIKNLYNGSQQVLEKELATTAQELVSVLLTLNEYPYIRYHTKSRQALTQGLATLVDTEMKKKLQQLKDWKQNESRERGTLLIVDRSLDPVAPLMHEYTYQCMINDLLKVNGELVKLPMENAQELKSDDAEEATGELVLSEDDSLWVEMRHFHIGQVLHDVTAKFKEFKGTSVMAKVQTDSENASVKDMITAMKEMPKYKDMMKKYAKHVSLAQACMGKFDKKRLKELGELEQDMATGLTENGDPVVEKVMKEKLVRMCQSPEVSVLDKLRLLMIFIISQSAIQEATRKELMKAIDTRLQKAVLGLDKLGVDLATSKKKARPKHNKSRLAEFEKRAKTIPMALMRYVPILHQVISELCNYSLSEEEYPYIQPAPPSDYGKRKTKATRGARSWRGKDTKEEAKEDTRPYFIVFMLGGVTFSELRSMYELAENAKVNLLIGSSTILRPAEFIRQLAGLNTLQFKKAVEASAGKHDDLDDLPDVNPKDKDEGSDDDKYD